MKIFAKHLKPLSLMRCVSPFRGRGQGHGCSRTGQAGADGTGAAAGSGQGGPGKARGEAAGAEEGRGWRLGMMGTYGDFDGRWEEF